MTEAVQSKQAKDTAETERQSVQKLKPAEVNVGGAKTNVKGIASVQSGKVTVKLENGDLAIADDMEFENKTQGQLYNKAKHFDTNAAKTFTAVYEADIPVNDYYLGFSAIHGAARTGKTFEQAVQLDDYTATLPSHIQQAAYNSGAQAGAIADDASMKNTTSVRAKAEQQSYDEWFKEHKTDVIAKKNEIGEKFKEAEANGDVAEMNKQLKEYQALDQWSEETIRDKKVQIGKAVGGMVELGKGNNSTDISINEKTAKILFEQTTVTNNLLYKYLENNYSKDIADEFAEKGFTTYPVQIPKDSSVLNEDGSIDWSQAPEGGYVLDSTGNAIKGEYIPRVGEFIDRYGSPNGRYTSPIVDGKPYNYDQRALPYIEDVTQYHKYEVTGDMSKLQEYVANCKDANLKAEIEGAIDYYYNGDYSKVVTYQGNIASIDGWGSGGGIQYEFPIKIEFLEKLGILKEIH